MIEIMKYDRTFETQWDNIVENSINGTIFHTRKFINYHPKDRFEDDSLIIKHKGKVIALFPAAKVKKDDYIILKSHPGTSYGGPVLLKNIGLKKAFQLISAIEEYAKLNDYSSIEFRICPKIFHKRPCDELDFAFINNGFKREDEELSTCYYLPDYQTNNTEELIYKFDNSSKGKARQGINKGIKNNYDVRELLLNDYSLFYDMLNSNLKKHNTNPVHSLNELIELKNIYSHNIKISGVYFQNILIGGFLLMNINTQGWHIFYSAMDYKYTNLRPMNFLLFKTIEELANDNQKYLNFGISTEDGGRIINWDLFQFKESFNGMGILRTYWKKSL